MSDDIGAVLASILARIDRLQDALTQQGRDIMALLDAESVVLDLMVSNQRIAGEERDGVKRAHDIGASNSSVLTDLVKRVRQLEADVRNLKAGPS